MRLPRLSSTAPSPQAAIKFERLDQSSKSFFLSIFRPLEPATWCIRRTDQEPPLLQDARRSWKFQQGGPVRAGSASISRLNSPRLPRFQNTARFCVLALVASENRGSGSVRARTRPVTYSPSAGPCLNPCPEPPPTNQTFSIPGCWSIRKSPLEVFSYWQTRVSKIGESFKAANRRSTHAR